MNERAINWIAVEEEQPEGAPVVFMYSENNNEYSVGHFTLSRERVPVTHWHPLVPPTRPWTPWYPVESSNLGAVRFKPNLDKQRGVLAVKFRSGDVYHYEDVPSEIFGDLADPMVRISKGSYFKKRVKDVYEFEKVED